MNMTSNAAANASLPVLETYIPPDVVSDIKQKMSGGDQIYDITAVKAPVDSAMMNQNNNTTTGNATMGNNSTVTATQTPAVATTNNNQNATTTDSASTTTTTSTTTTMANTNGNNQAMAMPQSWNYVVRVIRNGAMTTETVDSNGSAVTNTAAPNNQ